MDDAAELEIGDDAYVGGIDIAKAVEAVVVAEDAVAVAGVDVATADDTMAAAAAAAAAATLCMAAAAC